LTAPSSNHAIAIALNQIFLKKFKVIFLAFFPSTRHVQCSTTIPADGTGQKPVKSGKMATQKIGAQTDPVLIEAKRMINNKVR